MNQFEAAKLKAAKQAERKARYVPSVTLKTEDFVETPQEAPKEKPKQAAFIHVKVVLPDREITVCLMKPGIYQNISPNRLTKSEIKKCIEDGFRPLLGGLDDIH